VEKRKTKKLKVKMDMLRSIGKLYTSPIISNHMRKPP